MSFDPSFGFGMMQGGGSYGGPLAMQRMRDPRNAYARELIKAGVDTSPVYSPLQGLARVGTALVGGYEAKAIDKEWDDRESSRASAIANALRTASGTPEETKNYPDGTTIKWQANPPNMRGAIEQLAGNRDTAELGLQWQGREMQAQREREAREGQNQFTLRRDALQNEFSAAQGDLGRAHAAFLQDRSAANQAALQAAQQRFTAAENAANRQHQVTSAGPIAEAQAKGTVAGQLAPAPDQYQTPGAAPKSGAQVIREGQAAAEAPGKAFDRTNTLRDEYNNITKDFRVVQDAYSKIKTTSDTGPGDMSLLYSYYKLLDPGSTVRESEFAMGAAAGSFGERLQGMATQVINGQRLAPNVRDAFKSEAEAVYNAQKSGAERMKTQYGDIAKRYGLRVEDVITDYADTSPAKPSGGPSVGVVEDGYRFKGGNPSDPNSWEQVK